MVKITAIYSASLNAYQFSIKCEGGCGKALCLIYSKLLCVRGYNRLKRFNHTGEC